LIGRRGSIAGVIPALVFTTVMVGLPLLLLFGLGFLEIQRGVFTGHLSMHGYADIFTDPFYAQVFGRTLMIAVVVTLCACFSGIPSRISFIAPTADGKAPSCCACLLPC
jgi:ABC-type spermidine/putrescine transport system permease subunit I